jgi:hypothetical protein
VGEVVEGGAAREVEGAVGSDEEGAGSGADLGDAAAAGGGFVRVREPERLRGREQPEAAATVGRHRLEREASGGDQAISSTVPSGSIRQEQVLAAAARDPEPVVLVDREVVGMDQPLGRRLAHEETRLRAPLRRIGHDLPDRAVLRIDDEDAPAESRTNPFQSCPRAAGASARSPKDTDSTARSLDPIGVAHKRPWYRRPPRDADPTRLC